MTGDVSGEISTIAIPARITLRFWFEARALAVIREHAIRLEREQVCRIEILSAFEWSTGQPNGRER